jgi:hydrogenase maturation protease
MPGSGVAVLGLGNVLMQDEGIGVHLVNMLAAKYEFDPAIQLIDGGTTGTDLLPYFDSNERIMILDAVDFGKKAGHVEVLRNDEILARFKSKLSLHHLGLSDVLSTLQLLEIKPEEICLIGMQPASMELDLEPSQEIRAHFDRAIGLILDKLGEWQITCNLK